MGVEDGPGRVFVGRSETVAALHERLEAVRTGKGGVTLLMGVTGVGKSTLVAELAQDIRARGIRTLIGRALALDDPPPYSLIQSAFESMHDDPTLKSDVAPLLGGDQPPIDFGLLLAEAALPARVGIEQQLLNALDDTERRGKTSRDRALRGIVDKFHEFTQKGPTVLILDELHRADESSLAAVELLASQLRDRPLWILATSRPFASLSEVGQARLQEFERVTGAQQIVLHPLSAEEVASYLRVIDPSRELSHDEVARRYAQSGGNPLLLRQLEHRISAGSEVRDQPAPALPVLDEQSQRILNIASVLGPEFTFPLLLGATGEEKERLAKVVDGLVSQGFLLKRTDELLEFPQDRLREEAYGRLTESERRRGHQRTAETREALAAGSQDKIFGLARDFYLGRSDRKSVEYNRIAAEIAEGASAPDVARDFLAHALESLRDLDPGDREGESALVLELARVTYELGHLEEAEGILRNFLDRWKDDPRLSPRVRATLEIYLAQVLTARGDLRDATALAEKVLSNPKLEGERLVRIGAHAHLGLALYYDGQYPEALAHQTEVIRLAQEVGNERALAHAQLWRAGCLAMMGQSNQAIIEARQVAAALDRLGSVGESAQGHLFLGNMLADDKSTPQIRQEALAELGKAIRLGAKAQDPRRVGWAFFHSAEVLRHEERFKEADENAQQAYDTLARIGDRVGQAVSMKVRGQVAMARGDYELAQADLLKAHGLLKGLNNALNEIDVVLRLAQLSLARGERPSALAHVAELEHMKLPALRPDLAPEFEQLKDRLAAKEADRTPP